MAAGSTSSFTKMEYRFLNPRVLMPPIFSAAKKSSVMEADTEDRMRSWLKYSGDRDGERKRRAEKKKAAAKKSSVMEADTEDRMRSWLKYSGDRDGERKRRAEKKKGQYMMLP
ncbi:UNVERIFIED_CONTAM: hypothetical protein FKN15_014282 [Acipenser sinensis]